MRLLIQTGLCAALVGMGYCLGTMHVFGPAEAKAQAGPAVPTEETVDKITAAGDALGIAMRALDQEGLYKPAINGMNAFAVTVGGVDALKDLEEGRGVDPETFAGLYAGQATDTVAASLGKDDKGRLTYKGKLVRMYSIDRLKELFARRVELVSGKPPARSTSRP